MRPEVNLLPKYERYSNASYILFIVGLVICLLLAGTLVYFYFSTKSELETAQASVNTLTEQKNDLETRLNTEGTSDSDSLEDAIMFAESYVIPTSILIDELFVLLPDNSYLSDYLYDYNTVKIETQFEEGSDTADYVDELTNSPYMDNVKIDLVEAYEPFPGETNDMDTIVNYDVLPRYNAFYSFEVNGIELREEVADE